MSIIKRDNYERFFIDYLDGVLTKSEMDQLLFFLKKNPDLQEEFDDLLLDKINIENISFNKKGSLKRNPVLTSEQLNNLDELCIASLEGDLNLIEQTEFNKFLEQNSFLKNQYDLFGKTILIPDENIIYRNRPLLKKPLVIKPFRISFYKYSSFAASVVLLLGLSLFIPKKIQNDLQSNYKLFPINQENNTVTITSENVSGQKTNNKIPQMRIVADVQNEFSENRTSTTDTKEISEILIFENLPLNAVPIIGINKIILPEIIIKSKTGSLPNIDLASNNKNEYQFKKLLIQTFNKKIFNKESDLNKIQSWDIAQLAITGINRIAGTQMSLKKKYDLQGNVEELEFNSKLIAFSTPVKN